MATQSEGVSTAETRSGDAIEAANNTAGVEALNSSGDKSGVGAGVPGEKMVKFIEADAGDGTKREDQYLTGAKMCLCMLSTVMCLFVVGLDQTIVSTILTEVGNEFDGLAKIGWMLSGFLLPIAVFAASWGRISIIFGRKYTMLVCVLLFEVGSLISALSKNLNMLIGGRVLSGIGGGGIQSLAVIVIAEISRADKRPVVFATLGIVMGLSIATGPVVGGSLAEITWRWCFYINLPIGCCAMVFFFLSFNPPRPKFDLKTKFKLIDYLGTFLLTSGLVLFLVGLTLPSDGLYKWKSATVIILLILGGFLCIGFCVWNFRYSNHPLIPKEVVLTWGVITNCCGTMFLVSAFVGIVLYTAIYFQNVFEKSPLQTGLSMLPLAITVPASSVITGFVIGKTKVIKPFTVTGTAVFTTGIGLLSLYDVGTSVGKRIGYLVFTGCGAGVAMQGFLAAAQLNAPKVEGGLIMTTSLNIFLRGLGPTISSVLCNVVYNSSLNNKLKKALTSSKSSIAEELRKFDFAEFSNNSSLLYTLSKEAQMYVKHIMADSILTIFYFLLSFAVLSFICAALLNDIRVPTKEQVRTKEERDAADKDSESTVERKETNETV